MRTFRQKAVFAVLLLLGLPLFSACSREPLEHTPVAMPLQETAQTVTVCTLVGCFDILSVKLEGEVPAEYVVAAEDRAGRKVAIHCFADSQTWKGSSHLDEYSLAAPETEAIRRASIAPSLCDSGEGYLETLSRGSGDILWVVVQCFEPKRYDLLRSKCEKGGATFFDYAPEDVSLTVYWDGDSKTTRVQPAYSSWWPNGPDCEPECRSSGVTVTLP